MQDECKAELRSFWIRRASDVRYDPPLLAACAHEASSTCAFIDSPTRMFGCLRDNRKSLRPICRTAVLQRQAAAAEDISLDPDLARECKDDRARLCKHTSWGEGSARD